MTNKKDWNQFSSAIKMARHMTFAILMNFICLTPLAADAASQTQISRARSGYVSEADAQDVPISYGYWDYTQPQMSFRKTATSPMFYGPFLGLLAVNAIDIEATRASGCGEAHDFGRKPSRLSQYGQDYAADFAIGTMAFFMHRSHFRLIPQGMLGYGIAIHIRGAVRGFQANCH